MTEMLICSVNTGRPREVEWRGEKVWTAIFKSPVDRALALRSLNIDGDQQADLEVHGGVNKAVYVYASEHYPYWNEFLQKEIETGAFGENITTRGLLDDEVCVGDEYRFGTAILIAIQPRLPCFKLGIRFNDPLMTRHFFHARKNGIYFRVKEEGMIQKGDSIQLLKRSPFTVTIQDIVDNYVLKEKNLEKVRQITEIPFFPEGLKHEFRGMLLTARS